MDERSDFIGRGFPFPLGVDHTGSIALTEGAGDIERAIRVILSTARGERVMRPEFGCRIWDLLFEPVNTATLARMRQAVFDALGQWDPRISVLDVVVRPDRVEHHRLDIAITYVVRATNDTRNLVYPFYVIPREEEA